MRGPKGEAFLRLFKYLQPPCGHKSPSSCLFTNANQRTCTFLILTTSLESSGESTVPRG